MDYLTLPCHHQNDFCIETDSNESHFDASFIVRNKATRVSRDHNYRRERRAEAANRTGVVRVLI